MVALEVGVAARAVGVPLAALAAELDSQPVEVPGAPLVGPPVVLQVAPRAALPERQALEKALPGIRRQAATRIQAIAITMCLLISRA